jgi:hypothetical protein
MSAPQVTGEDLRRISKGLSVQRVPAQPPAPPPPAARLKRQPESVLDGLRRRKLVDDAERSTR